MACVNLITQTKSYFNGPSPQVVAEARCSWTEPYWSDPRKAVHVTVCRSKPGPATPRSLVDVALFQGRLLRCSCTTVERCEIEHKIFSLAKFHGC